MKHLHKIIVLLLLATLSLCAQGKLVVGYYPSWMKASFPHTAIKYRNVTHIAHAFIFPTSDGSLDLSGFSYYPELINAAHLNGVGVVISVGGYDPTRTPRFRQMVADTAARRKFVAALKTFCISNNYDGVDLDWEYPSSSDRANATLLFRELWTALSDAAPRLLLSIAAPSTDWNNGYDWTVMNDVLDWVGVMTYDFYGSWLPKAGPNSPLYGNYSLTDQGWIDNSVSFYKAKGLPTSKILIGTPFYGWQFTASAMYGTSSAASQLHYNSIAPYLQQGWTRYWDATTRVPHLINSTQSRVISYDDAESIAGKMKYVREQSLGGTIIWALGQDYIGGQQPLMDEVALGLGLISDVDTPNQGEVPLAFRLFQNFPNPFNGRTQIRYSIAASGKYTLRVFDVLGRQVQILADRHHRPGEYQVSFSSDEVPTGMYFYRLTGEGAAQTNTMIVLR
jgi:chitinase